MLTALCVSLLSWLAVCLLFWALSKAFRNGLRFREAASVWGLSYIRISVHPAVRTFESCTGYTGYKRIRGFIIGALFILLLVRKAIYYFIFLRFVMDVSLKEFLITVAASAVVFAGLIYAGMHAGIQVPML